MPQHRRRAPALCPLRRLEEYWSKMAEKKAAERNWRLRASAKGNNAQGNTITDPDTLRVAAEEGIKLPQGRGRCAPCTALPCPALGTCMSQPARRSPAGAAAHQHLCPTLPHPPTTAGAGAAGAARGQPACPLSVPPHLDRPTQQQQQPTLAPPPAPVQPRAADAAPTAGQVAAPPPPPSPAELQAQGPTTGQADRWVGWEHTCLGV